MPVDKALLESCIAEASGDDADMATFLRDRYTKNDTLAAKFVGGYTRTQDYTQKTQKLAEREKTFEGQTKQLETLRISLETVEAEKNKMMKQLAAGNITVAKARAMAQTLKDNFNLTDEDLPGMSDLIETAKTGKVVDSTDTIEERLAAMRAEITKELEGKFVKNLAPELGAMADLHIIWPEIMREHEELTGKRLTVKEQQEILSDAKAGKGSLRAVWEDKFQVGGDSGLRMTKLLENKQKEWETAREKKEADDRSKKALEVVTGPPQRDLGDGPGISNAFKTRFKTYEMDPAKPAIADNGGVPSLAVQPGQHVRQTGDRGPSGGQRAAQKFLEKQAGKATVAA